MCLAQQNKLPISVTSNRGIPDVLEGDGRKDEDITSKGECDVIDLTNEDSSSDDEEQIVRS